MEKRKKKAFIISGIASVLVILPLVGLIVTGANIGWGPFKDLFWSNEVERIKQTYKEEDYQSGIVFYGASNFRLWAEIVNDKIIM